MAKISRKYLPQTKEAASLLGNQISIARRERKWTIQELAERVGVDGQTINRVEKGDPTTGLGVTFDVATILGIPLFSEDPSARRRESRRAEAQLALLPERTRRKHRVNDDF